MNCKRFVNTNDKKKESYFKRQTNIRTEKNDYKTYSQKSINGDEVQRREKTDRQTDRRKTLDWFPRI